MPPATPTGVPEQLVAGDSWRWRHPDFADYPESEGWDLFFNIVGLHVLNDVGAVFQTSGDDDDHWLVEISTLETRLFGAGRYRVLGRIVGSGTYDGREETLIDAILVVEANPADAEAGQFQTHNEKVLTILEAAIEGRLTADIENYQIGGRAVSKIPAEQLVKLRAQYAAAVHQERTGRFGRPVKMRFPSVV